MSVVFDDRTKENSITDRNLIERFLVGLHVNISPLSSINHFFSDLEDMLRLMRKTEFMITSFKEAYSFTISLDMTDVKTIH